MDLAREIAASFPEIGIVLLAPDPQPELMRNAMQAGIRDVVALPLSLDQLETSVRAATSGRARCASGSPARRARSARSAAR